jgi:hypothetical protein
MRSVDASSAVGDGVVALSDVTGPDDPSPEHPATSSTVTATATLRPRTSYDLVVIAAAKYVAARGPGATVATTDSSAVLRVMAAG